MTALKKPNGSKSIVQSKSTKLFQQKIKDFEEFYNK